MSRIDLEAAFTYHAPREDTNQPQRFNQINLAARALAEVIEAVVPDSPERTLAIRKVQEARMWGNAAIAINEA
ncbi:MAG: hypothetical protein L0338_39660 [Acidobacteria bacterium]|nr:hypothetical protein [Acidobacteriota bacterium]